MTRPLYVRMMDRLYDLCFLVAMVALVAITIMIFTGVVMRYVFWMGARFAEPMSIFFVVQLTMYGAAACYRARIHLRLLFGIDKLNATARKYAEIGMNLVVAIIACAMIYYGIELARITWFQAYPEFDYVRVGLVYSAIPGSGLVTLLFAIEALVYPNFRPPNEDDATAAAIERAGARRPTGLGI